jgi:acyl-CoA ligase (AMP-forming) (exosortase A-associated)
MASLLSDQVRERAEQIPDSPALSLRGSTLDYARLEELVDRTAAALLGLGVHRFARIAVYLPKQFEFVAATFGSARAGCVFVPINPLLKPTQVGYILRDCNASILITAWGRAEQLREQLGDCPELEHIVVVDSEPGETVLAAKPVWSWGGFLQAAIDKSRHRVIDVDMTAILYTSGSTGQPKGVVLSHRNMVAGARSVVQYLGNCPRDRLLAVLPFSFDAGFSQLTTGFTSGACVVMMDYLLPKDVVRVVGREQITGLTGVPPLWVQLSALEWSEGITQHLRYIASTGGAMPGATLQSLREKLPQTQVFLMYGLTEAFRSTYLPPQELDRRPGSIGKAIPNTEILVVREDGSVCEPDEPGELVHRGALVAMGYWNDPQRTALRFKPAPGQLAGIPQPEIAVWSGDTVKRDADGFLYFLGRRDDMIKTSGYRVSPEEIEEVLYASGLVSEAAAVGVPDPRVGHAVAVVVVAKHRDRDIGEAVVQTCARELPAFMVPSHVSQRDNLPRNPNGKIDRKALATELQDLFVEYK